MRLLIGATKRVFPYLPLHPRRLRRASHVSRTNSDAMDVSQLGHGEKAMPKFVRRSHNSEYANYCVI